MLNKEKICFLVFPLYVIVPSEGFASSHIERAILEKYLCNPKMLLEKYSLFLETFSGVIRLGTVFVFKVRKCNTSMKIKKFWLEKEKGSPVNNSP